MNQPSPLNRREFLVRAGQASVVAGCGLSALRTFAADIPPHWPQLNSVGRNFTIALIADPQIEGKDTRSPVCNNAQKRLSQIVTEINAEPSPPAFVLFNGDLVNNPRAPQQIGNFLERIKPLQPLTILAHGNHDGLEPYTDFREWQKQVNGAAEAMFSFNCGGWHFATVPCNFQEDGPFATQALEWLARDLAEHRARPTMLFIHYPLLPQGLTQLEWYTYDLPFRQKLLKVITSAGNVRYVIHGHVHNGIKAAAKIGWTWRGIQFITAPTCTASRPFGEEFKPFRAGLDQKNGDTGGGYYLMIDMKGDQVRVRGRLAGVKEEFIFPKQPEYRDQEPLWFCRLDGLPMNPKLVNGNFTTGLKGWLKPWRLVGDEDPMFICEPKKSRGTSALRLRVREKGQPWAQDEQMEVYQIVGEQFQQQPLFRARYRLDSLPVNGGGFFRLCGMRGADLRLLVLLHWDTGGRDRTRNVGKNAIYLATGEKRLPWSYVDLGQQKKAVFIPLPTDPGRWHEIAIPIATAYDGLRNRENAFVDLGIEKWLVAAGVWCLENPGSISEGFVTDLSLTRAENGAVATLNKKPIILTDKQFTTDFGLAMREK